MSFSRCGGPNHDDPVAGLLTGLSFTLGRDIVDGFNLPSGDGTIAVSDTPRLTVKCKGGDGNGYPDLLVVICSAGAIFSAVIEVKRTPQDLLRSQRQYAKYLGCSSAFFIAVPSNLLHVAVSAIRYPLGLMQFKGVINANTGDIVVLPRVQRYDTIRNLAFLTETMTDGHYLADPVRYGFRSIAAISSSKADYVDIDGMLVRGTYLPIVQSEADKRYPRDEYFNKYVGRYLRYGL